MAMKKNETRIISYCAVFQAEEDGINIDFPDLQGCLSCSFSQEDSIKMAEEALSLWLDGQKYEDLPQPTSPTIATNSPGFISKLIFFKVISKSIPFGTAT